MGKKPISIEVLGNNAESVAGSCTRIKTKDHVYLFELGMIQEHTTLGNYNANSKMIQKIKPKEIDFIVIGHFHCDHICMIPALYEKGKCDATIIVPEKSSAIIREMWLDSCYINQRDLEAINSKNDRNYQPLYTEAGVFDALKHIREVKSHEIIELNEELSIRYSSAGHILLSMQTEMFIKQNAHVSKILFTSDLGNVTTEKSRVFVDPFEPVYKSNIVFGECTYCGERKEISKQTFEKDLQKIKTVIEQYCVENRRRVLIPTFSLDRMPYILWLIYQMFKDEDFNVPIVIDSPLANRLLDCYSSILEGDAKEKFDEMMAWTNIRRIIEPEASKAAIADNQPKVILSSSGMLTAGRSIKWVQSILPQENDCILFVGYAGTDTLAHKIKYAKDNKTININGKPYKNKCAIYDLTSFSSHMQRKDLINYYKSMNCEKIYLVHGDGKDKLGFKEDLEEAITQCLKSTRVISVNKGMKISI